MSVYTATMHSFCRFRHLKLKVAILVNVRNVQICSQTRDWQLSSSTWSSTALLCRFQEVTMCFVNASRRNRMTHRIYHLLQQQCCFLITIPPEFCNRGRENVQAPRCTSHERTFQEWFMLDMTWLSTFLSFSVAHRPEFVALSVTICHTTRTSVTVWRFGYSMGPTGIAHKILKSIIRKKSKQVWLLTLLTWTDIICSWNKHLLAMLS